jgi:hypothetical protein
MIYSSLKYIFLTISILLNIIICTQAQEGQINATAPSSVAIGQAFNYVISGDFDGDVRLPALKGLRLVGGPSKFISQQSSIINGRIENTKSVSYTGSR